MAKYECPYCHEKTFSIVKKAMLGGPASKGKACSNCGKHCVNGMKVNIINTIILMIAVIVDLYIYYAGIADTTFMFGVLAIAIIINKVINGFVGEVEKNNRMDL